MTTDVLRTGDSVAATPNHAIGRPELPTNRLVHLGPGRTGYAAGFLLDDRGRVLLVRKRRPLWQAGKLNGVGGHIEPGETAEQTMRREFREEAGLDLDGWEHFACVTFPAGVVWFFRLRVPADVLDRAISCTDEPVEVHTLEDAARHAAAGHTIDNLAFLLPLAAYQRDVLAPVVFDEVHSAVL